MASRPTFAELEPGANFIPRHIGPDDADTAEMLRSLGAKSLDDFIAKNYNVNLDRNVDPSTHQVTFYAGENMRIYFSASVKTAVLTAKATSGAVVTVDPGFSVVSGTLPATARKSIYLNGMAGQANWNVGNTSTQDTVSKTLDATQNSLSTNVNITGAIASDVTVTFNPVFKIGDYTLTADDFTYTNNNVGTAAGVTMAGSTPTPVTARAADAMINFDVPQLCVNLTGLATGDVISADIAVSDGTSNVGDQMPYWMVKNADGTGVWGPGFSSSNTSYTLPALTEGQYITVSGSNSVTPTAGKTYTFGGFKVVKDGTTTNLVKSCGATAATAVLSVNAGSVVATLTPGADAGGMMGNKYDMYQCNLYASTDSAHATVIKSSVAFLWGMTGPLTNPACTISGAPAGTYSVSVRGLSMGMNGTSDEKFIDGTVTVTAVAPAKSAPKVPAVLTKVKVAKTITVALSTTKGTAAKGANVDGLPTTVTIATASKAYCSVTAVKKSGKITSYTVKGLKAGKCSVVLTITGNATYNSLTKTVAVTVSK